MTSGRRPKSNFNPPAPCGAGLSAPGPLISESSNFNPPAPCGAGRCDGGGKGALVQISIHPPHAGRDFTRLWSGGADRISIHPPHAGRDPDDAKRGKRLCHFNPPAPCGAGRKSQSQTTTKKVFQSTRPMRGGTVPAGTYAACRSNFNPPAPCGAGPL